MLQELGQELRDDFLEIRSGNHALVVKGKVYKRVEDAMDSEKSNSEERDRMVSHDDLREELL